MKQTTELFGRWGQHVVKTPKLIIGLGHMRNVGKDVAKNVIYQTFVDARKHGGRNPTVHSGAFAEALYETCENLYGWAGMQSKAFYDTDEGREVKEVVLPLVGKSPRKLLIDLGMAVRENVCEETWLKRGLNVGCDVLILSDMRFPNEAQAIREADGVLIKITRPSLGGFNLPADDPDVQVVGWNDWDFHIVNQDTLEGFEEYVRQYTLDHLIPLWESRNGN